MGPKQLPSLRVRVDLKVIVITPKLEPQNQMPFNVTHRTLNGFKYSNPKPMYVYTLVFVQRRTNDHTKSLNPKDFFLFCFLGGMMVNGAIS